MCTWVFLTAEKNDEREHSKTATKPGKNKETKHRNVERKKQKLLSSHWYFVIDVFNKWTRIAVKRNRLFCSIHSVQFWLAKHKYRNNGNDWPKKKTHRKKKTICEPNTTQEDIYGQIGINKSNLWLIYFDSRSCSCHIFFFRFVLFRNAASVPKKCQPFFCWALWKWSFQRFDFNHFDWKQNDLLLLRKYAHFCCENPM